MCWTVYESNYIPGMNQCKNLRMQLCPHWITHPSWQELIALKWMVYSPLARGIKINARRVNSVSSPELPPPTIPILNQPAVPSTQLEEIRRGEKKKGVQENEEKNIHLFCFQHLLSQLGKKIWAIRQAPCCCPQVFNSHKGHSVNTTITNNFLALFFFLERCLFKYSKIVTRTSDVCVVSIHHFYVWLPEGPYWDFTFATMEQCRCLW